MKNKIAFITGATSGIGEATALLLAAEGYDIVITGRREERLAELKVRIENEYGRKVKTLCFDIRCKDETLNAFNSLSEDWKSIDILINNAGLASGLEPIQDGDFEDWDKMIDTNIKGLLYITRIAVPEMIKKNCGHIVNIGSIAGKEVYPNGGVYCATKHAVDALSKAMRMDLVKYGIKVTQVCPGAVKTEFSNVRFHGDDERAEKVYDGFVPLTAEDVASVIKYAVTLPDHICLNDILVMPKAQASAYVTYKE